MTNMVEQLVLMAQDVAPVAGARIAAALTQGNKVIGFGVNQHKSHPLQARFASNPERIYLHAEIAAIINANRRTSVGGAMLWVVRVNAIGEMCMARPCEGCWKALKAFDINNVVYSVKNGVAKEYV